MKKLILLFLLANVFIGYSQDVTFDELQANISKSKTKKEKVNALNELGNYWFAISYDSATAYYKKAYEISKEIKYKDGVFDYASNQGNVYLYQGKYDELIKLMKISVENAKKYNDKHNEAKFTVNLGNAFMSNAEFQKALRYFQKGIQIFNDNKEYDFERKINLMISVCFSNSKNLDKAIEYSKKALSQAIVAKDSATISKAYENIGSDYLEKSQFKTAKPYILKGKEVATKLKNLPNLANLDYYLSRVLHSEKKYKEAIDLIKKSLSYYTETGNDFYKINALTFLSIYQKDSGDYQNALQNLKIAEDLALKNDMKSHLLLIYPELAQLNKKIKNYELAYNYLEKHYQLNDSVSSNDLQKQLLDLDTKYQAAKKDLQIKEQESKLKNRRLLNYVFAGTVLAILLITFLVYRNLKRGQTIQQQKINELETEKQLTATEAVLRGEEQERSRLAKDLHDGLGGMLSGVKFSFNAMKQNLIMTPENAMAFERSIDQLDNSIREMRRVAHNMLPENLMKYGLDSALRELCSELNRSTTLKASYQSIDMEQHQFSQEISIACYRIIQELVNNSLKYSKAKDLLVQAHFSEEEKILQITVEDNGEGFDKNKLLNAEGIGWKNIQNRVQLVKGKIDLNSEIGKGTSVLIEIPIV